MATPQDYVELRSRSSFSFLEGCSNPEDLVEGLEAFYGEDIAVKVA